MSYDLHFVPTAAGADPEAIQAFLEAADANSTAPPEASQHELAESLLDLNRALERFNFDFEEIAGLEGVSVEDARRNHSHID